LSVQPGKRRGVRATAAKPSLGLSGDVTWLKGAGPVVAAQLKGLGIERVVDLLLHLPLRYEDRRAVTPLSQLRAGDDALVRGRILASELRYGPRRSLRVVIEDDANPSGVGGALLLRFFHFSEAQQQGMAAGRWLQAYGSARAGTQGVEMVHPEYRLADSAAALETEAGWVAVYRLAAGLGQTRLRSLVARALRLAISDPVFARPLPGMSGPATLAALRLLHLPPAGIDANTLLDAAHPARQCLIEEELLAHQLAMRQTRAQARKRHAPPVPDVEGAAHRLQEHLPFALTGAQRRAIADVAQDLATDKPMLRLLQGDVGCGKTLVAVAAMLGCAEAGLQAVLMAPTELLAEQHARTLSRWMKPLDQPVGLLSGKLKSAQRKAALKAAVDGDIRIWIGTHALFQAEVDFARLALVVVDEQHRFGVGQRLALRDKANKGTRKGAVDGAAAHQLIMSATPIPRTLAQTLYADLDISIIDELPPGRTPVTTVAMSQNRREDVLMRIGEVCREGRQAYWVCTLIEESDQLQAQAAEDTYAQLRDELPGLHIGLVHGRLKSAEKEAQMRAFAAGRTQVLVATTVIEVGVDVPNASIMVIDNAERLGLAQLHQLRGRVGRGAKLSQCVLMYRPPLLEAARSRLEVLRSTHDGFRIAEHDLALRGPGELLGRRQTGLVGLKIADPLRDARLIPVLQRRADEWLRREPALARQLIERWVGDSHRYVGV